MEHTEVRAKRQGYHTKNFKAMMNNDKNSGNLNVSKFCSDLYFNNTSLFFELLINLDCRISLILDIEL